MMTLKVIQYGRIHIFIFLKFKFKGKIDVLNLKSKPGKEFKCKRSLG